MNETSLLWKYYKQRNILGEVIGVNKEENLLLKKIILVSPKQENSEQNKSFENKNTRLQLILRIIEDENENKTNKDKNEYNNYESFVIIFLISGNIANVLR